MIVPGQQAIVTKDRMEVVQANMAEAVAWKNSLFIFENADIASMMQEIGRWYDVKIAYQGFKPVKHFNGQLSRQMEIRKLLELLTGMGGVRFQINRDTVIVSQ